MPLFFNPDDLSTEQKARWNQAVETHKATDPGTWILSKAEKENG